MKVNFYKLLFKYLVLKFAHPIDSDTHITKLAFDGNVAECLCISDIIYALQSVLSC